MTVVMSFVIIMIIFMFIMIFVVIMIVFVIIMIVFVIMIAMIFIMVVVMIFLVIMILLIIIMVIDMNLAVEMFCLSPHQSRTNGSLDREGAAISEAPLKNATKQTIDGVMPWVIFEIVVETAMALDGENGREVEFTGFKTLSSTTMGAVGLGR